MGAGLIYCEMVSDKAVTFESKKTMDLLKMDEMERPISQQIFGSDIDSFVTAAKKIYELQHPDIIDINMGCPVPKVAIKNQAGSALLKDPKKIGEIVSAVVNAVPCPVTVKIRSGWDEKHINAVEVAKVCENAGASAIAVHARTRSQGYSGNADWNIIKQVKEAVSIPVIGNGDVTSCYLAKKMLDETKCDAVMIGRGVLGNPWLIKECVEYLENGTEPKEVTYEDKINMMRRHYQLLKEDKGEITASLEIRTFILYYLKGIKGSKEIKNKICQTKSSEEIFEILDKFEQKLKEAEYEVNPI
jgi:nifR3 family TIM-barrel protein